MNAPANTAPYPWELQPALLYCSGHSHRRGYVLSVEYGEDVRFVESKRKADALIERFNRMQWRKWNREAAK